MNDNSRQKRKQINIELRSEEVQELMGRKPSFILNYGISVIFVLLMALFFFTKYMSYQDSLDVTVELVPKSNTHKYVAMEDLIVLNVKSGVEFYSKKNDTIAVLQSRKSIDLSEVGDTIFVICPFDAHVYKADDFVSGDFIWAGSTYMLLYEQNSIESKPDAVCYIDKAMKQQIRIGMEMRIRSDNTAKYFVSAISQIPSRNSLYSVYFMCEDTITNTIVLPEKESAYILTKKESVFDKIFVQGLKKLLVKIN